MSAEQIILVVSSKEEEREALKNSLCRKRVIGVRDSAAAVSMIRGGLVPSLVVIDATSEEVTMKILKRISKHISDIPVMAITPPISKELESRYFMAGITDILHHPVTAEVLCHRANRHLKMYDYARDFESRVFEVTNVLRGERKRNLRLTMQILSSLASTIDAKDEYTRGHSNRVSAYSLAIAKKAECLSTDEFETLMHASLLHDVGKIGISDSIIRKPGRLTDEEYRVIQDHPTIGWNILKSITMLPGISWVARWHHEHYDGGGYPDGLSGDAIPVMVRMVSIADSYDAMTSNRSYRGAMSNEKAIKELKAGKGKQFDPYLVDITIPLIESGEIRNRDIMEEAQNEVLKGDKHAG